MMYENWGKLGSFFFCVYVFMFMVFVLCTRARELDKGSSLDISESAFTLFFSRYCVDTISLYIFNPIARGIYDAVNQFGSFQFMSIVHTSQKYKYIQNIYYSTGYIGILSSPSPSLPIRRPSA